MIKRRFGDDFHAKITPSLEIKAAEAKRNPRDNKRRPRADGEKRDRKPRDNKDKKEGEKAEPDTQPQAPQAATEQTQEQKAAPAKREGRRRGGREGQ